MRATLDRVGFALVVLALAHGATRAQTFIYWFNGVPYSFPTAHAAGALRNNGVGVLTWTPSLTPGMLAFTTSASCPAGWVEHTAAQGRYLVGLPSGGTVAGTAGTALTTASENRTTGQHTAHATTTTLGLTDPQHTHAKTDPGHFHTGSDTSGSATGINFFLDFATGAGCCNSTNSATTGITFATDTVSGITATATPVVANGGSTAGTNAPYVPLLLCQKS
jgi:hypothetical protein